MLLVIKSLLVLAVLFGLAWRLMRGRFLPTVFTEAEFNRYFGLTAGVTLLAYVSLNVWLYVILVVVFVAWQGRGLNPAAVLASVLFAVPYYNLPISVGATVLLIYKLQYAIIWLQWHRLAQANQRASQPFGRFVADWLLLGWVVFQAIYALLGASPTHAIKVALSAGTDTFLVYWIFSRAAAQRDDLAKVIAAFLIQMVIFGLVAVFESVKGWLLYPPIEQALGVASVMGNYLSRDSVGLLRAQTSTGHPIVLGAFLGCAVLLLMGFSETKGQRRDNWRYAWMALLLAGLLFTISRGPWVAAAVGVIVWIFLGPDFLKRMAGLALGVLVAALLLHIIPGGEKIIDVLPWIGKGGAETVDYRELLFQISLMVFWENPWLGAPNYMSHQAMQLLIQGEGIIDMVNSYLGVALGGGFVGLFLYAGGFVTSGFSLMVASIRSQDPLQRSVFGALVCLLVTLGTVSTVNSMAIFCWVILGLVVSAAQVSVDAKKSRT
jgi:O-antigen ligase